MSFRFATWLAWSLWALCVTLVALAVYLDFYTPPVPPKHSTNLQILAGIAFLLYPTVGAFVASRRSGNAIGWVLTGMGLVFTFQAFAGSYADYALYAHPGSLPGGVIMLWTTTGWMLFPGVLLGIVLLVLLFPDGRPPNRGLWAVVSMALGGTALMALGLATQPGPMDGHGSAHNPFAVSKAIANDVMWPLGALGLIILLVSWIGAVISVHLRLDSASGVERAQIKWFAYAAVLLLFGLFVGLPATEAIGGRWASFALLVLIFWTIPVAVGLAIFRHRLYDVDVVINRTLVYGSLTGILALVYFGGVTTTQAVLQRSTGQEELPQLVIVASTLVIAALFTPLRRRIQAFIDRRFYRRKYNARKTLEGFSATLRDETNLDRLGDEMVGVVRETIQPAHVGLWLRPDREAKSGRGEPRG